MAQFLHYQAGNSLYHRHDARMKFMELCGWNILILNGPPVTLFLLGLLVFILSIICNCRLPGRALIFLVHDEPGHYYLFCSGLLAIAVPIPVKIPPFLPTLIRLYCPWHYCVSFVCY